MLSELSLSDRMKNFEKATSLRFTSGTPVIVRLDGVGFSNWTARLDGRPFNTTFSQIMNLTGAFLARETNAKVCFVQSDEISLVYLPSEKTGELPLYGGKVNKINSILAAMASAKFNELALCEGLANKVAYKLAYFDCRSFEVPDLEEATNAIYARFKDCVRNSISMWASSMYSHKALEGKNLDQRLEMCENLSHPWTGLDDRTKYGCLVKEDIFHFLNLSDMTHDERKAVLFER